MKSELQAELLGLHVGDGTLYSVGNSVVWELRGGLNEQRFYDEYITNLLEELFSSRFFPKYRSGGKGGCYGFQTTNKEVVSFLMKTGFKPGPKTKNVQVPKIVLTGTQEIKKSFLRGLFATDGTIYLAKINRNVERTYPIIEFASASQKLRNQVSQLLRDFLLESYSWTYTPKKRGGPCYFLRLSGREKAEQFIQKIGFSDPKHQSVVDKLRKL